MFKEYEVKILVKDVSAVEKRCKELGFELKKYVKHHDFYFDTIKRDLLKKDERLRVRVEYDAENEKPMAAEFSWKGPREGKEIEIREDSSTPVSVEDAENLKTLLGKLGYRILVPIFKIRKRFQRKEIELEFDEHVGVYSEKGIIPIGSFLQASIETSEDEKPEEVKEKLWFVLSDLGFSRDAFVEVTYVELALEKLDQSI